MKPDACNIYDCEVRNEMLKQLPQGKTMTQEKIFEIEKNTRDQSSCDQWYDERKNRLTASNFGAAIKRKNPSTQNLCQKRYKIHEDIQTPQPHANGGMGKEENAIKELNSFYFTYLSSSFSNEQ